MPISHTYQPNFGVNLKSPKLRYNQKDFFINIRGYGRDTNWASVVKSTADTAVNAIRQNETSEDVLKAIAQGVKLANQYPLNINLRVHSGILRTPREGWDTKSNWENMIIKTSYLANKYKVYVEKLKKVIQNPLKNPYDDIGLAKIEESEIIHPSPIFINNAFKRIETIYEFIQENFIKKDVKSSDIDLVNDKIAEIRWIMAHSMPWERGSDSTSNIFMRALYKAMGIKAYPSAKGISYDLEAFCTNLDEYKAKFNSFFEKPLEVIE